MECQTYSAAQLRVLPSRLMRMTASSVKTSTHVGSSPWRGLRSRSTTTMPASMRRMWSSHMAAAAVAGCADTMTGGSPSSPAVTVRKAQQHCSSLFTDCRYRRFMEFAETMRASSSVAPSSEVTKPSNCERLARLSTAFAGQPTTCSRVRRCGGTEIPSSLGR